MSFRVNILRCSDCGFYTDHTDNLEKRFGEHQLISCYTFNRRHLNLVFLQDFPTREETLESEQQIKDWSRKKKEAMIYGDWAEVSHLAKSSKSFRIEGLSSLDGIEG